MLAGADRERGGEIVLPVPQSPMKITDSRSSIQEPSASAAIVACGTFGLSAKRKSSSRLICGNRASISRRLLAALGALGHLGLQQRGEVGDRGLLLAERFGGQLPEPAADGRELQLDRVRLDQRLQRLGLRVGGVIVRPPVRAAGRSRRGPARAAACAASRASRPVSGAGAVVALGAAGEDRDRAAVDARRRRARRGRRARPARRAVLAAEQQHVDHLPGGLRASVALGQPGPQLVEAVRPGAAIALLAQRERVLERRPACAASSSR